MLGLTSFASVMTIIGGLGIQMNAYLAEAKDSAQRRHTASIEQPMTFRVYVEQSFADVPILADVARCESEFRQFDSRGHVIRGTVDRNDVGVMQINERYHLDGAEALGYDIYSVEGNMAYARYLYETRGLKPWNASKACWSKSNNS